MHSKRIKLKKHSNGWLISIFLGMAFLFSMASCKKDDYYKDSGLTKPTFDGTTMDYLDSLPFYFDSVATVVRLAGMEDVFQQDTLTFFAPTDLQIQRLFSITNLVLYASGYDTIRTLNDVPAQIWRKYLTRYMFHGRNQLKDYPQIDYDLLITYPGQGYLSWDGAPMNIGVVYHDENKVKYVGYRQLTIAYIPDLAHPTENWTYNEVGSSNIFTYNGVVHVINENLGPIFGFDPDQFIEDMEAIFATGTAQ